MNVSAETALLNCATLPTEVTWHRRLLHFKIPARTSRGDLTERVTNIIEVKYGDACGLGECCTMPGLLPMPDDAQMDYYCRQLQRFGRFCKSSDTNIPSPIRFAAETAMLSALRGGRPRWDTPFTRGEKGIKIHHLIWMSDIDSMLKSMATGIENGFCCLKMKVGALPFEQELQMLKLAKKAFPHAEIRVDANGAFTPDEALRKLHALAEAGVDSIEQPIAPGQWKQMAQICRQSPIPIALDEELIAHSHQAEARERMLSSICPAAIVIKPSLHGGLVAAELWNRLAASMNIDCWVNSALESSIGLTALAEWCSYNAPDKMHGLGTGRLFKDDTPEHIALKGDALYYIP